VDQEVLQVQESQEVVVVVVLLERAAVPDLQLASDTRHPLSWPR